MGELTNRRYRREGVKTHVELVEAKGRDRVLKEYIAWLNFWEKWTEGKVKNAQVRYYHTSDYVHDPMLFAEAVMGSDIQKHKIKAEIADAGCIRVTIVITKKGGYKK
jgi:hypothetical protein